MLLPCKTFLTMSEIVDKDVFFKASGVKQLAQVLGKHNDY